MSEGGGKRRGESAIRGTRQGEGTRVRDLWHWVKVSSLRLVGGSPGDRLDRFSVQVVLRKKILVAEGSDGVARLWLAKVLLNHGGMETAWLHTQVVIGKCVLEPGYRAVGRTLGAHWFCQGVAPVGGSAVVDLWNDPVLGGRGGNGPFRTAISPFPVFFFNFLAVSSVNRWRIVFVLVPFVELFFACRRVSGESRSVFLFIWSLNIPHCRG